jgi:CubicO group peptidase (beta-lactamase class C family)
MDVDAALDYARKHASQALLVDAGGEALLAQYEPPFGPAMPHALYSGTKSFWGVAALYARDDGLLELDEPVCATIPEWATDPWKRRVTIEMLLALTAGIGFGGLGNAVPNYERALATTIKNEPGTTFTYGGIPLQIFGAVLAAKLRARGQTPHEYLRERVLEPAGVQVAAWRSLKGEDERTHPLPTGASLTAGAWLTYGRFVLAQRSVLEPCFTGTAANPRYGLGWWLAPEGAPRDLFYASGSGGQALYVVPSLDTIVVRFGNGGSFDHAAFLKRLFGAPRVTATRGRRPPSV